MARLMETGHHRFPSMLIDMAALVTSFEVCAQSKNKTERDSLVTSGIEIILMGERCSALDPTATAKTGEAMVARQMNKEYAIIIVTHNMQQVARVPDYTAFFYLGELVEFGTTQQVFEKPKNELAERYITGKFS